MALIRGVRGYEPAIGNDTWLAENATIIGNVKIGDKTRACETVVAKLK